MRLLIFPHLLSRFRDVEDCDRLLVVGTTLATYSAFRIVKHALELKKPVFVLNTGPTRADDLLGIEKVDGMSGSVLPEVVRALLCVVFAVPIGQLVTLTATPSFTHSGSEVVRDPTLSALLSTGIINPPPDDAHDLPRAAE